jgi:hypothetical protein
LAHKEHIDNKGFTVVKKNLKNRPKVGGRKGNNAPKGNSRDSLDISRNWFRQQQRDFKINSKQGVFYTMALPLI